MEEKVTLEFLREGKQIAKKVVDKPVQNLLIGRHEECHICLESPSNTLSRRHCMLNITPPHAVVRDFGSLGGTKINGHLIGKRPRKMKPEDGNKLNLPQVMLYDGNVIDLPDSIQIKVSIEGGDDPKKKIKCQICSKQYAPEINYAVEICNECMAKIVMQQQEALEGQREDFESAVRRMIEELGGREAPVYPVPPSGYRIIKELGRGGMGITHLLQDNNSNKVVMKTILPEKFDEERYDTPERKKSAKEAYDKGRNYSTRRFEREMFSMKELQHKNIVGLVDYGTENTGHYILLEYCNGGDLSNYIKNRFFKEGKAVDLGTALTFTNAILDGLDYMHNADVIGYRKDDSLEVYKGLVHRDIKPGNIFLYDDGDSCIAKIGDFGLAKAYAITNTKAFTATKAGGSGTYMFMCRQQYLECKYFNPALPEVDVWAAAAMLYYMLSAEFPRAFSGKKDPAEEFLALRVDSIAKHRNDLPKKLIAVIDAALDDSEERLKYQSANAFKKALEEALR